MLVTVSVADVMRTPALIVDPEDTVAGVATRLRAADGASAIVAEGDRPIGILTEADVVGLFADDADRSTPVRDVMSVPVRTVDAEDPIEAAAEAMRTTDGGTLAVCDEEGCLAGVLTATDLADYVPAMARRSIGHHDPATHRRSTRPDTAYEHDEWDFASYGEGEDSIDVGDVVTFAKPLTESDVAAFAEASGDTNRLHLDAEYAERSRFGRRIVHGTLVVGLISAALARLPGLTIYLSQDVSYSGPVDVGRTAEARCEVIEELGGDRYRLGTAVHVADEPVVEGEATVLSDPVP